MTHQLSHLPGLGWFVLFKLQLINKQPFFMSVAMLYSAYEGKKQL